MRGVGTSHPLHDLYANTLLSDVADPDPVLDAFDQLLAAVTAANPGRLGGKRKEFRGLRTDADLRAHRAELVIARTLAVHDVGFDFGGGQTPQPDILLRDLGLAVEIKARELDGWSDLLDDVSDLVAGQPVAVAFTCEQRPLVVKPDDRAAICVAIQAAVADGVTTTVVHDLDRPWSAAPALTVTVTIKPRASEASPQLTSDVGPLLTPHLEDVENVIFDVSTRDEQKIRQATVGVPTILVVDVTAAGVSWLRPAAVWGQRLAARLPEETPFVGVGVLQQSLHSADPALLAVAIKLDAPNAAHTMLEQIGLARHSDANDR